MIRRLILAVAVPCLLTACIELPTPPGTDENDDLGGDEPQEVDVGDGSFSATVTGAVNESLSGPASVRCVYTVSTIALAGSSDIFLSSDMDPFEVGTYDIDSWWSGSNPDDAVYNNGDHWGSLSGGTLQITRSEHGVVEGSFDFPARNGEHDQVSLSGSFIADEVDDSCF